jgi:hypothetical protein
MSDQFELEAEFEKRLLAFVVRNLEFYLRNSHAIRFDYFENQFCRDICEQAQRYVDKYGSAIPKDILRNEIEKMFFERKKQDIAIEKYWEFIDNLFAMDLSGKQYTEDEVLRFAQRQQMTKVLGDAIDRVTNRQDLTPILEDVTKALSVGSRIDRKPCITLSQMFEKKVDEPDYIIRTDTGAPILEPGTLGYLVASYKVGKTLLAQQFTVCSGKGAPFLGFQFKRPYKVLYIRFELSEYHFRRRFLKMNSGIPGMIATQPILYPDPLRNFNLLNEKDQKWLFRQIDKYEAAVLILDPLYKLTNLNLAKPEAADPFIRATDGIREQFPNLTTILPHHQVKGTKDKESWDSTYGPMQLFAHMDFEWKLTTIERNVKFQLSFLSNAEPAGDLILERDPDHLIYKVTEKGTALKKSDSDQTKLQAMDKILKSQGKMNKTAFREACKDIGGKDLFHRLSKLGEDTFGWKVYKDGVEIFYEADVLSGGKPDMIEPDISLTV